MYVLSRAKGHRMVSGSYPPRTVRSYQVTCYAGYSFISSRRLSTEKLLRDYPGEELILLSTSQDACVWLVGERVFVLSWKPD